MKIEQVEVIMVDRRRGRGTLLMVVLLPFLAGCGTDRFEQEVKTETSAVTFAREVQRGEYEIISTDELKQLLDSGTDLVLVDTMPYDESFKKEHIAGAKNFLFPIPDMTEWDPQETGGKTQEQYAELLGPDKDRLIVIYCGFVKCTRSHNGAVWARKLGYTNVKRHPGGIFAWKGAGHATEGVQ